MLAIISPDFIKLPNLLMLTKQTYNFPEYWLIANGVFNKGKSTTSLFHELEVVQ